MIDRLRAVLLAVVVVATACEKERRAPQPPPDKTPDVVVAWKLPADIEPLVTDMPIDGPVEIGGTRRLPDCWEWLERDGEPVDPFPFTDRAERAVHLASCGVEARHRFDDGAQVIAWGSQEEPGSRVRDLHIARWDKSGKLTWSIRLDRSRQAANWAANFRRSFITSLPKHLCAGTLWEGDTQAICVDHATGEPVWKGSLPFWSGIEPQASEDGLVVADISAITKRYPFDGSEMTHTKLEGLGGRAGYYATDGPRLYFAPSRIDAPPLIAYDLSTFSEQWRTPLPGAPAATLAEAWDRFDRVLVKVGDDLVALDTESGKFAWAYDIGDDIPSIAADDAAIYILSRRPELPNRLTALDPKTGERRWSTDTPPGTLRVTVVDGLLFIGSIRAVQQVTETADGG